MSWGRLRVPACGAPAVDGFFDLAQLRHQCMQATISQLVTEYQSHSGAVNTSTSPKVQYAYSDGSANHVRRTSLTYPSTKVVTYDYGTSNGGDDLLSRVAALKESTTTLVEYSYLGLSSFVRANYSSQPGVELTYIKQGSEGTGDAGDQYTGLDCFGRVYDQRWLVTSSGTAVDRFQYGFDRNSNRVFRDNLVASSGQDEYYSYDNLNQLSVLKRGDLNAGRTDISGTPVWQENFTFDPTGNWHGSSGGYVTRTSGVIDLDQNRSNNPVNEITGFTTTTGTGWATPGYNAVGNMTTMPQPASLANGYTAQYDAWNRLVELKNGTTTVATYRYDGATRRVTKLVGSNTTHFYYSDQWQILEERLNTGSSADRQFVWGQRYIDDLVLRDQSTTRHYVLNDLVNVTSIINTSGTVQERYGYNAFGTSRVMNASFVVQSSSSYNWETRFAAYRWDSESGLYQVRYRYYHPLLGTWINRDPIEQADGLNIYAMVGNSPLNRWDFFGLAGFGELRLAEAGYCCVNGKAISHSAKETIKLCFRAADIIGAGLVDQVFGKRHCWVRTSDTETGQGVRGGGVPGQPGSGSSYLGVPTQLNDHTGQSATWNAICVDVEVNKCCIEQKIAKGKDTGRWFPLVNDCNTVMEDAVKNCGGSWEKAYGEYLSKNQALQTYLGGLRNWSRSFHP